MDFLDPRKTRARKFRLMLQYTLATIAIAAGTVILVYGAYGYDLNTKNGDIIQNGLLFLDSKPSGAGIFLNGKYMNHGTSDRLVLPAGKYDILLHKDGYADWQREIKLKGQSIARYVYPFLFPQKPLTSVIKVYPSQPQLFMESPDFHWLLVQTPDVSGKVSFDQYDTTNLTKPSTIISIPDNLITGADSTGSSWSMVEWSSDNNNVLLEHTYPAGHEFIVFDRDDPAKSFNVNKTLGVDPTQVAMFNKKVSQFYIYQQDGGTLSLGDIGKGTVGQPILRHILAFNPYQSNIIDYVTQDNVPNGMAQARIWNSGHTYPLYTFKAGNTYLLNTASYSGHTYFAAGDDAIGSVNVYKDPLNLITNLQNDKISPAFVLNASGADKVTFSDNARFVAVEGGQNFGVYDFETKTKYEYSLQTPVVAPLQWMDGHRLMGESASKFFVMDYDSTNQHELTPTTTSLGGFFSGDYNHLFTLAPVSGSGSVTLDNVDMRAGVDLPQNSNSN